MDEFEDIDDDDAAASSCAGTICDNLVGETATICRDVNKSVLRKYVPSTESSETNFAPRVSDGLGCKRTVFISQTPRVRSAVRSKESLALEIVETNCKSRKPTRKRSVSEQILLNAVIFYLMGKGGDIFDRRNEMIWFFRGKKLKTPQFKMQTSALIIDFPHMTKHASFFTRFELANLIGEDNPHTRVALGKITTQIDRANTGSIRCYS